MNRYKFSDVFKENSDGSLTPKCPLNCNGVSFGWGIRIREGEAFGGVDFHLFKNSDIAGIPVDNWIDIKGFYN